MRTTIKVGEITLKNGEMIQIPYKELEALVKSKAQNGMGDVYFPSLKRMLQKNYIVDVQEKWIPDPNAVIVEERADHLIANKESVVSDGTGEGYKKFLAAKAKLLRRMGSK